MPSIRAYAERRSPSRRIAAEFVGTAFLLAAVVGSGIMGQRLAAGNDAIALLANTISTGAALLVLILAMGPISGAHFNPVVSIVDACQGGLPHGLLVPYLGAQVAGAFTGVAAANVMFELPAFTLAQHARTGGAQWFSEWIATFGLVGIIWATARFHPNRVPFAVAAYIISAYWFTSSTSFANPAVTLARAASDTFAGIRLMDVPGFVVAQLAGGLCAMLFFRWLVPDVEDPSAGAVIPGIDKREEAR